MRQQWHRHPKTLRVGRKPDVPESLIHFGWANLHEKSVLAWCLMRGGNYFLCCPVARLLLRALFCPVLLCSLRDSCS